MSLPTPYRWRPAPAIWVSVAVQAAALACLVVAPRLWPWVLAVVAANHGLLGLAGMWPRGGLIGANLARLPAARAAGQVVLTFDDGPHPEVTPAVLDLLDRFGASASFFCVGHRVAAHPALARDILRRGHSLENHTQTHPPGFACFGPWRLRRELAATQRELVAVGATPRWFRAPMGLRTPLLDPVLARLGLRYVAWSRRGHDTISGDAAGVLRRLTRGLREGDILLLHDGYFARTRDGQPVVLAVLPKLLEALRQQGLQAVSLPVALGQDAPAAPIRLAAE